MKDRFSASLSTAIIVMILGFLNARAEDAVTVVVGEPRSTQPHTVELPGGFESYEDADLYAKVTGYVSKVHVDIGDRVPAGTPLVLLDIPEMKPTLERARADVFAAEAALEKAKAQVRRDGITRDRLSDLQVREPLAVTQQDVDMAEADLEVSRAAERSATAEISVARAKVEELEALMDYAVIRAPFEGVVAKRLVDPGELVVSGADGGNPLLQVVREDWLRLVLAVPESIVPQTRVGTEAMISVGALSGLEFGATITRCSDSLSRDTRTMRAEIDVDNRKGSIRPGMYAKVRLEVGHGRGQLSVPTSVIRRDNEGQPFVWTVRDGAAAKARVEIARDDGISAVIATGLRPDTTIVLEGSAQLREGQPVRVAGREEGR